MHQQDQPLTSQAVSVYGTSKEKAYTRMVSMREVTFTCAICHQTVTQLRYPSKTPLYCSDACKDERAAQRNEERVRRQREKRQQARVARSQE